MHNLCENNLLFELGRGVYVQKKMWCWSKMDDRSSKNKPSLKSTDVFFDEWKVWEFIAIFEKMYEEEN